jgi:hypothetical protein
MPIEFFTSDLQKTYERFNQSFGRMIVCNVNTRQRIILAIISLGLLERKITAEGNKDLVRSEIQMFIRTQNILNQYFDEIERRHYEKCTDGRGSKRQDGQCLPGMSEHLQDRMAQSG